jgi:protein-L-isoaspartate(D-aspartate) O-methyltransferase
MNPELELAAIRREYARRACASAGVSDPRIEAALAAVRREEFLGPGPWQIAKWPQGTYELTPDANPVHLYTNDLIGISPEKQINNGAPSFHAPLIARARPSEGEHAVHIGAGVGYYTAILANLVGKSGRVTGVEYETELAQRARENLVGTPNVRIVQGDGTTAEFDNADVIYVNAGATRPADSWLNRLSEGGRLVLPLTSNFAPSRSFTRINIGVVFLIERRGADYLASWISDVAVFPCAGNRDATAESALAAALQRGDAKNVTRLYRGDLPPPERCWLRAPGWCLAYS